jgi:phi13 family phage major tail protein
MSKKTGKQAKNSFFGAKNFHVCFMKDETTVPPTYEEDVYAIPGLVELTNEIESNTDTDYADDGTWVNENSESGGSGKLTVKANLETDPVLRKVLARMTGKGIDSHGRTFNILGREPEPCAIFAEQSGKVAGKRTCKLKTEFSKPNFSAATKEDKTSFTNIEMDYKTSFVKVAEDYSTDGYDDYPDTDTYATFFDAVNPPTGEDDDTNSDGE